jgi:erythromycin esterase
MSSGRLAAGLLPFILACYVHAQVPDARVDWLKAHAAPLRSLDPADDQFDDLEPIGRAIGSARIVMLGEGQHGEGTTHAGKARLVRYLHERKGFDVLVFESGFYECQKAWEAILAGKRATVAAESAVMRAWSWSTEAAPLMPYLESQARGSHPLFLAGFDPQFTGSAKRQRQPELREYLKTLDLAAEFSDAGPIWTGLSWLETFAPNPDPTAPAPAEQARFLSELDRLGKRIDARAHDARARFWLQVLDSARAYAKERYYFLVDPDDKEWTSFNMRDSQSGRNLLFLANDQYKGRKLIVWSATIHAAHDLPSVSPRTHLSYAKILNAGQVVWDALGSQTYTIGFVSLGGTTSLGPGPERLTIKNDQQPEREIEELLGDAGFQFAFLDYRRRPSGGDWLRQPLISRPFGEEAMLARWPDVLDGLVFIRDQQPAHFDDPLKR